MIYKLEFELHTKKEWDKLDKPIKEAFKTVILRRLDNPIVSKDRLSGTSKHECYKIKLRNYGFRLAYKVDHDKIILLVIGAGKRENDVIYDVMHNRLKSL
jgi:mRNA interferase RelE/StbE